MAKKVIEKGQALIQSKTFWFNVLSVIVAVATLVGFGDFEPNAEVTAGITTITAVINVLLRLQTKEPITRFK